MSGVACTDRVAAVRSVIHIEGALTPPGESAAEKMVAALRRQVKEIRTAVDALVPSDRSEAATVLVDDFVLLSNLTAVLGHVFSDAMRYGVLRADFVQAAEATTAECAHPAGAAYVAGVRMFSNVAITGSALDRQLDARIVARARHVAAEGAVPQPSRGGD